MRKAGSERSISRYNIGLLYRGVSVAGHGLEYERARAAGANAASNEQLGYDDCPYDEDHEPVLRAMWQDGFLTTKLYGTG